MLGRLDSQQKKVTVLGGGFAGLLAAYTLDRHGYEVNLVEEKARLGGLIDTQMTPWGMAEAAAHSFLATEPVLKLCEELGVDLVAVRPQAKARFIRRGEQFLRFPLLAREVLPALLRAFLVPSNGQVGSLSMENWTRRFLGEPVLKNLVAPFVHGIYGVNPDQILISAAYPVLNIPKWHSLVSYFLFRSFKQKWKGESRSKSQMVAPRRGMQELIDAFEKKLRARISERIQIHTPMEVLPTTGNVVITVPAYRAAALFSKVDPALSQALTEVKYTSLVSVTVFLPKASVALAPTGVGFLTALGEKNICLGMLYNSNVFPGRVLTETEWNSYTVILDGSWVSVSDADILKKIQEEFELLFGLNGTLSHFVIKRYGQAIPIYDQKLKNLWALAQAGWCSKPGRLFFGNYTGQVSLRGMMETICEESVLW